MKEFLSLEEIKRAGDEDLIQVPNEREQVLSFSQDLMDKWVGVLIKGSEKNPHRKKTQEREIFDKLEG